MTGPASAVVLAAGEGSRLRPLTQYNPKPMLAVANRPIIDDVVEALRGAATTNLVIVVDHQHRRRQDHLNTQYPDLGLTDSRQPNQLGSVDSDQATVGANVTLSLGTQIGPGVTVNHSTTVSGGICEQVVNR